MHTFLLLIFSVVSLAAELSKPVYDDDTTSIDLLKPSVSHLNITITTWKISEAMDDITFLVETSYSIEHGRCSRSNKTRELEIKYVGQMYFQGHKPVDVIWWTLFKIVNPEKGKWYCFFKLITDQNQTVHSIVNIKDLGSENSRTITTTVQSKPTTDKPYMPIIQEKVDYTMWIFPVIAANAVVVVALIIIVYLKIKVNRCESNEIPNRIKLRKPEELPSEVPYDTVYNHCIGLRKPR